MTSIGKLSFGGRCERGNSSTKSDRIVRSGDSRAPTEVEPGVAQTQCEREDAEHDANLRYEAQDHDDRVAAARDPSENAEASNEVERPEKKEQIEPRDPAVGECRQEAKRGADGDPPHKLIV